jgi:hypothetical protein
VGVQHWGHQPAGDEEEPIRNWRPPQQDTDFAAHAGQAEKRVLQQLEFNLLLDGREIGSTSGLKWIKVGTTKPSKGKKLSNTALATALKTKTELTKKELDVLRIFDLHMDDFIMSGDSYFKPGPHGLDSHGFLTPDALQAIGIDNYTHLWRRSGRVVEGKVVEAARKILQREKCSAAAREQVRLARIDLELSIFYRQMDVMAFRFPRLRTQEWYEHKAALLKKGKRDIINEYRRDTEDRERTKRGEAVASSRKQELASSACEKHLCQLHMRYKAMLKLQDLLLCQVR